MSCGVFLELLAREASPVEFEGPLVQARAEGAPPAVLAELEAAKLAALRVRAVMRRHARREAELAALFDTAGDLAGLRDLDAVLEAITRRARRLLNADIAYLTLNDDARGDTYMRVTDGSVSAAFRRLRLPMGTGLVGLVAQTAMPYNSDHYLVDAQFQHRGFIDQAVAEEGLVAILGVPMKLGSRVIGVLTAANRGERPFDQEEVALLGSLAAHAAIAIDNARLLEETRTALEELSAANEEVKARSAAVEVAARAHDRMTAVVVRGGGVEDVAAIVTELLGGTLHALDADGARLATAGAASAPLTDGELAGVSASAHSARAQGRTVRRGDLWIASVSSGDEMLGTLVLRTSDEVSDADQRILERAALVTALLLLFQRSVTEAEGRVRGELLDDLLSGRTDAAALAARARRVEVDLSAPHVVLSARYESRDHRRRAEFWASSFAAVERGLAASRGEEVVLLLPGDRPGDAARRVAKELGASLGGPATVGAGGPVRGPREVAGAHREAQRCADALVALGRRGDGAGASELGFIGLLIGDDRDVPGFLAGSLGPVADYDARRGTALVRTLEAYFGTGGSLARTAQELHIHVNTVSQRLDRIGRLLGEDWQSPDRALELQLALRLHRLR
ncbi:GAF domain-containing protein [Actinomadura sp. WMMB 499]|uniref:helix-turn-helix domain-containing protein n=1 Tax=Actinomadura sp. WMMB 499 TaxID=1219491 RepID=UPI0020C796F9|nr:GAF domain-containing protein [Actinomadura sp. WMMB 499]